MVVRYWFVLTRHKKQIALDEQCPPAAVVLCVRGSDPTLASCLSAILQLDYPDFRVRIIADHEDDPACKTVRESIEGSDIDVELTVVPQPLENCSLKCSSLIYAIDRLKHEVEVVALIDADTQPHQTWLRELVAPMVDPAVGATTGVRWYTPTTSSMGSMMRFIWNAAAIVQMHSYSIAWGGTLCLRTSIFSDGELLKKWSQAFCEDTMTQRELRKQNLRLVTIPSLIMTSRESIRPASFVRWMRRQLLTSKLYHPAWPLVVAHCFSTTLGPIVAGIGLVFAVFQQEYIAAQWLIACMLVYELVAIALLILIESAVRSAADQRSTEMRWFGISQLPWFLLGLLATQLVFGYAMVGAIFHRDFDWRGIDYRIRGAWDVKMKEYVPYHEYESNLEESDSL